MANINWYPGHMAKTKRLILENLNLIDLVIEVTDARMPYSSKIKDLENFVKDKPRIMVMSKIDLCDMEETKKWIKKHEDDGNIVLGMNLNTNGDIKKLLNLVDQVMESKNVKREEKGLLKKRARILVVGIPNAGKSTLINRLVGKNATNTANKPGVTRELSWIRINENLELLDSPGILWPKLDEEKVAFNLASLTAIKEEVLPIYDVVEYILNTLLEYYPKQLEERYGVTEVDEDIFETLDYIGKRRGCLIKGGEIDYEKVVGIIISEIKDGTIKNITFDRFNDYAN